VGLIFTIVFTIECGLKVLAMGFVVHRNSYLRDGWNVVDFIVVCTGTLDFLPGSLDLKALRTLRVLRPLRSINAIPSMRRLVTTLLRSLPDFANVAVFLFFVFILFGILGLNQFEGSFYYRCRTTPEP
jgi:hypothetical protein